MEVADRPQYEPSTQPREEETGQSPFIRMAECRGKWPTVLRNSMQIQR